MKLSNALTALQTTLLISLLLIASPFVSHAAEQIVHSEAIDNVWSAHRIKPFLLTRGKHQFVAYFDGNRQMTVAHRELNKPWRYYKVDSHLGWDSHNYVTMELDKSGHLHVMGNMHRDPIEYFRTTEPYQVRSLKRVGMMVDKSIEKQMTYPIFMLNKQNELIVKYRDGGSGNGNEIYNIYDTESKQWSKLHQNQFLDGEGKMSGYFEGPVKGPEGNFHLIWVWRNTPNAATNHSLSYAKSKDLVHWTDSNDQPISLPITLDKTEVIAPVPPFGGMINGNVKIGFDQNGKPVVTYHRYDEEGNTQIYVTRKQGNTWKSQQISQWRNFRWEFGGHGSLGKFLVQPYAVEVFDENKLAVKVRKNDDIMRFVLDSKTLQTLRVENINLYPPQIAEISQVSNHLLENSTDLPLEQHVFKGVGDKSPSGGNYYLSWFSQPGNRDRAHVFISSPSVLLLHESK
ncbi:BNR repeat-containing protein [Aliiglaciecola sp. 3_MG-2023]|uniref:BNR repeat-containing protein n=1 Tax=Aliiglaciecola sp. 3_MG-2023 TaxID=3062644 RepID=UPI0026E22CD3|nr:BNR repeat-containing protein [Aliiglaciecola sp. 3_MG-2023]MDO6693319.1 BNR repeat-containing protein [Aliiglaciecola sp. 3_MG-2023]